MSKYLTGITKILKALKIKNLRLKLILSYIFVVFIPYSIIGVYFIDRSVRIATKQMEENLKNESLSLKESFKNQISTYINISNDIYFDKKLSVILQRNYKEVRDYYEDYNEYIVPVFQKYITINPNITKVTIFTENEHIPQNGYEISLLKRDTAEWNMYIEAEKHGGAVLWEYRESTPGKAEMILYRLLNSNFSEAGMLVIHIRNEKLLYATHESLGNGSIYLLSCGNTIVEASEKELKGKGSSFQPFARIAENEGKIEDLEYKGEKYKGIAYSFDFKPYSTGRWSLIKLISTDQVLKEVLNTRITLIVLWFLIFSIAIILAILFSFGISKRIKTLSLMMRKVQEGDFSIKVNNKYDDEIGMLTGSFNTMVEKLNQLVGQVYQMNLAQKDMEIKKREAEFFALQSQINPHFLFNTLDAILSRLDRKEEAERVIMLLAKSFRRAIRWDEEFVSIKDEFDFVMNYLEIQKFKMGDKLNWTIDVDKSILDTQIPKLIIQPIVENSIHHGISMLKGQGKLELKCSVIENGIRIEIRDNGIGIHQEELDEILNSLSLQDMNVTGRHVGIKNVSDRLKLYYGRNDCFEFNSIFGEGTIVQIIVPNAVQREPYSS